MADIAMCKDTLCKSKETCYRFKATPDNYRQAYLIPNREEDAINCSMYWEIKKKVDKKNKLWQQKKNKSNQIYKE